MYSQHRITATKYIIMDLWKKYPNKRCSGLHFTHDLYYIRIHINICIDYYVLLMKKDNKIITI